MCDIGRVLMKMDGEYMQDVRGSDNTKMKCMFQRSGEHHCDSIDQNHCSGKPLTDTLTLEFDGDSTEDESESLDFERNSSDDDDHTVVNKSECLPKFFEGGSDEDSMDFYEPTGEIDDNQYNFESDEVVATEAYKHLVRRVNNKDLLDYSDPLVLTKPDRQHCSRFCDNQCGRLMENSSFATEAHNVNEKFVVLDRHGKRKHLLAQLSFQEQFGISVNVFMVKSEPVCLKFFSAVSGVSVRVLASVVQDFKNGVKQYPRERGQEEKSVRMMKFISWMVSFASIHGEHSPDDKGLITLPSWLTKRKLYQKYCDDVGVNIIALSTFYQALGSKFGRDRDDATLPCIMIPKDSEHCKCNECLAYKKFKRSAKTELQLSVGDKLLQNHLDICARERMRVWSLFQRCVDFKLENLGLQFDDMDQRKTDLPKFAERSKSLQSFNQLKNHCTGVIIHSGLYPENRSIHFFLNQDQYEQGEKIEKQNIMTKTPNLKLLQVVLSLQQ